MLLQVLWVNGRMFAGQGLSRWLGRALVVFMVVDGLELAELSQSVCLTWAVSDRDRSRRARNTVSCHSRRTGAALMIYYRSVLFALGSSQLDSSKHGPQTQETPTHKYPFQHASSVEGILCVCALFLWLFLRHMHTEMYHKKICWFSQQMCHESQLVAHTWQRRSSLLNFPE